MKIEYQLLEKSKQKQPVPSMKGIPFGSIRTNHMFVMDYEDGSYFNETICKSLDDAYTCAIARRIK